MRIVAFDIMRVSIPMKFNVRHALAERSYAENVVVRAVAEDGSEGWGESCPRPYVTGEDIPSACAMLARDVLPGLLRPFDDFDDVVRFIDASSSDLARGALAAYCAAELAVLDLAGRRFERSAGSVLGPVRHVAAEYSGVIATEDAALAARKAEFMARFGFRSVKVKVGCDGVLNRLLLRTVRSILGDEVAIRVDVNCAWRADEALRHLEDLAAFGIEGVEQPVPREDWDGMRRVTEAGIVPVVADESCCTLSDAERLAEIGGCDVFNVRISKCGGLTASGRIRDLAERAGIAYQLGAQVGEFGILSAAGRHFATRSNAVSWCEGSFGSLLLDDDLVEPDLTVTPGGLGPALDGPGLGVDPIPSRLERYALSTRTIVN